MVGRPLIAAPLLLAFGEIECTADIIADVAIVAACKFYMLKVQVLPIGMLGSCESLAMSFRLTLSLCSHLEVCGIAGAQKDRKAGLFVSSEYLVTGIYYKGCLTHPVLKIIKQLFNAS